MSSVRRQQVVVLLVIVNASVEFKLETYFAFSKHKMVSWNFCVILIRLLGRDDAGKFIAEKPADRLGFSAKIKWSMAVLSHVFLNGTQSGTPIEISLFYFNNFFHPQRGQQISLRMKHLITVLNISISLTQCGLIWGSRRDHFMTFARNNRNSTSCLWSGQADLLVSISPRGKCKRFMNASFLLLEFEDPLHLLNCTSSFGSF